MASDSEILKEALEEMQKFSSNGYVQDYEAKDRLIASQMREEYRRGKIETAQNLIKLGTLSLEEIAQVTNLDIEIIEEMKNSIEK